MKQWWWMLAALPLFAMAEFPVHTNTVTCDIDKVTGNYDSFLWSWPGDDSQAVSMTVTSSVLGSAVSMTGYFAKWKLTTPTATGTCEYISSTNITISASNLSWTVNSTSMPPANVYNADVWAWDSTTNYYRTIGQGRIKVVKTRR